MNTLAAMIDPLLLDSRGPTGTGREAQMEWETQELALGLGSDHDSSVAPHNELVPLLNISA